MNKTEAISAALKTWRGTDLTNPLLKLAGEAGETLDAYGKHLYKPGYSCFDCVGCGEPDYNFCKCGKKRSRIEDELGDISYYLRILQSITDAEIETDETTKAFIMLNYYCSQLAYETTVIGFKWDEEWTEHLLRKIEKQFEHVCSLLGYTVEEVWKSNYVKLNKEDDNNHGWKE